jgi:hypothetical protein
MKIKVLLAILLLQAIPFYGNEKNITLENESVKVEFDKKYGRLIYLEFKKTGWTIQKRESLAQSFKLFVPTEDRLDNAIDGSGHQLHTFSKINNTITLTWKKLTSLVHTNSDIEFTGTIELTQNGLIFNATVSNRSNLNIEAVYWPYLGDMQLPNKTDATDWLKFEYSGDLNKTNISPNFNSQKGYWGVDYPTQVHNTHYSHFGLLQTKDQGIYFGYPETTERMKMNYSIVLKPGYENAYNTWMTDGKVPPFNTIDGQQVHYEFYGTHFPYVGKDQTVGLGAIELYPYSGDWHKGADFYKSWRTTWKNNLHLPDWANEVHSWRQIQINSAEDRPVFKYKELPKYCEECVKYKVRAIQLTGWTKGGQDRANPSHDIDPLLGTHEDLKSAIRTCENMGVKIILFNKYTWADESQDWFKNELVNFAVTDPYGNYYKHGGYQYQTPMQLADINTRRFVPMCTLSKEWRNIAVQEFKKSLALGASGMLFDENQHHGGAVYCFDASHGHEIPANIFYGDKFLQDDFWEAIKKGNPSYLLVGESNRDLQFQSYHMTYFRVYQGYVPMHRYVAPKEKMQMVVGAHNDRAFINMALKNNFILSYEPKNFKGKLSEIPRTMDYGNKMDALRNTYKDYLWNGLFMDDQGAVVTLNGQKYDQYAVFLNEENNKKAIVLLNNDANNEITLAFETSKEFMSVTVDDPQERVFEGTITLAPASASVLIEK